MRRLIRVLAAAALLVGAACGEDEKPSGSPTTASSEPTVTEEAPEFPPAISPYEPQIDPADFVAEIDNPYYPLLAGSRWKYEGESDGERETIVVTVTDETKVVMGVKCTVIKDVVRVDGEIAELTYDWYAQDRHGNVWYFGEDSAEYENGKPINQHGSWEAGVDGALPGIIMLGNPQVGDTYRQELYEGEAEDFGKVLELDDSIEVPYGSFDQVLITEDWNPLEPRFLENKYYAQGIGVVYEEAVKGADEFVELIDFRRP